MSIEIRLKLAREDAKLSQSELAKIIGISTASICRYEKTIQGMPITALMKIAQATNQSIEWLTYGAVKEENKEIKLAKLLDKLKNHDQETIDEAINLIEIVIMKSQQQKLKKIG